MDSQPHPERCFDSIYCIIHGFNDQEEITVMMVACGDASDIIWTWGVLEGICRPRDLEFSSRKWLVYMVKPWMMEPLKWLNRCNCHRSYWTSVKCRHELGKTETDGDGQSVFFPLMPEKSLRLKDASSSMFSFRHAHICKSKCVKSMFHWNILFAMQTTRQVEEKKSFTMKLSSPSKSNRFDDDQLPARVLVKDQRWMAELLEFLSLRW